MTIKQQGGIFGRNPTFNDVEVEGNLTVGGSAISEIGTIASQDADSVNIDGGAIDGVTLGVNSAVTEAQIDNININGNSITSTDSNGNIVINPDGTGKVGLNQSSLKADLHLNGSQFIGNTTTGLEISDTSLYISRSVSPSLARSIEMTYTYNSGHVGAVFRRVDTSALSALPSSGSVTSDILSMDASTNNVIISTGNLVIGTSGQGILCGVTSTDRNAVVRADLSQGVVGSAVYISRSGGSTSKSQIEFANSNGVVGSITTSGSATAYNTSSDYRLKTDAQPMTGASDRVKLLSPVNFEWISDGTRVDGFLAHEVQEIVPEAVHGAKDAMREEEYEVTPAALDEDGNVITEAVLGTRQVPDYQAIDQSKLVPVLTAALQEALAKIEQLESRVASLEV